MRLSPANHDESQWRPMVQASTKTGRLFLASSPILPKFDKKMTEAIADPDHPEEGTTLHDLKRSRILNPAS